MTHEPRVLIIEDDQVGMFIYPELFKRYQCCVDIVETAEIGLEKFQQEDYALLLVDIRLPKMNGFEFTKHIRASEKGKIIPIVGISAIMFTFLEDDFKQSGMDYFVDKPFTMSSFDNLLQNHGIALRDTK